VTTRRFWSWLLIPAVTLGLAEACVRRSVDRVPTWYRGGARIGEREPLRALFVGSSRVQSAIAPRAFDEALAARGRGGGRSLNFGRGGTTPAEHYLGLRLLLEGNPDHLRDVVVFIEAPGGLSGQTFWDSHPWAFEDHPGLLVDLIRFRDLPRFVASRGLKRNTRAHVVLRTLLRPAALVHRRERLRERWGLDGLLSPATPRPPSRPSDAVLGADLEGPGPASSVPMDPARFGAPRRLADELSAKWLRDQVPFRPWAGSIQEDTVRLVRAHGGQVVFFDVPQGETLERINRTPMRRADAAVFAEQVRLWDACLVRPAFPTTESDFPDVWHLHPSRAPGYSVALANAWLDTCGAAPAP
jgi:hypothetical protein